MKHGSPGGMYYHDAYNTREQAEALLLVDYAGRRLEPSTTYTECSAGRDVTSTSTKALLFISRTRCKVQEQRSGTLEDFIILDLTVVSRSAFTRPSACKMTSPLDSTQPAKTSAGNHDVVGLSNRAVEIPISLRSSQR
jgi:hypothetical protein